MSYDFAIEIDTGGEEQHYIEPYFSDTHPAFEDDGMAGTAVITATGYSRCGNYTSNVSGMWARCLTEAATDDEMRWAGDDDRRLHERNPDWPIRDDLLCLRDLKGRPANELAPLLARAVMWGVEHIDELHERDPENGWGNADGAVTYLWDIQRMCEQHPRGRLYISS